METKNFTKILFVAGIFLNSFILFLVQPYVGKLLLPYTGGTAATWAVVLLFFQGSLLLGYGLCYLVSRDPASEQRRTILLILLALAGCGYSLHVGREDILQYDFSSSPISALLEILGQYFLLPSVMLSSGSTLYQRSAARLGARYQGNPYYLYSFSNVGSFLALLFYPFLIEPFAALDLQNEILRSAYLFNAALLIVSLVLTIGMTRRDAVANAEDPSFAWNLRWIAIPACTSGLLVSFSVFLSTNIAPIPLLWVGPLFLFLLSYAIGFSAIAEKIGDLADLLMKVSLVVFLFLWLLRAGTPFWLILSFYLITFLLLCLVAHTTLYSYRPEQPARLPAYYLCIAFGGFVGGCLVNFIAPLLFNDLFELPLFACAAGLAVLPRMQMGRHLWVVLTIAVLYAVMTFTGYAESHHLSNKAILVCILGGLYLADSRATSLVPRLFCFLCIFLLFNANDPLAFFKGRNFYGTLTVVEHDGFRSLFHGVTVHGSQKISGRDQCLPGSYYHSSGPGGSVLAAARSLFPKGAIGLVGIGTGALACYLGPEQQALYFELNPQVMQIAQDRRYFTYLANSHPAKSDLYLGDARSELRKVKDSSLNVIVIDAFHSDAIPVHLLTKEAFAEYFRILQDDGVLLVHISNIYLNLVPVVKGSAREVGATVSFWSDDKVTPVQKGEGKDISHWALIGKDQQILGELLKTGGWSQDTKSLPLIWTDQYSSIYSILSFE